MAWQASKTAPKDGRPILTWDGSSYVVAVYCACKADWYLVEEANNKPHADCPIDWDFTHWQHIEAPPTGHKKGHSAGDHGAANES